MEFYVGEIKFGNILKLKQRDKTWTANAIINLLSELSVNATWIPSLARMLFLAKADHFLEDNNFNFNSPPNHIVQNDKMISLSNLILITIIWR